MLKLESLLACPKCKTELNPKGLAGKCLNCKFPYKKEGDIWELVFSTGKRTRKSQKEYDKMHKKVFDVPQDGSYEILASFARGNRAVDIAAGDGFLEALSPQTVAVEFSKNALLNAKKKGAKYLVLADAHHLPFVDNSFDVSISTGNLEQFENQSLAVKEMVRISKIQILTVHREFDFPFASQFRKLITFALDVKNQPIEKPVLWKNLKKMLENAGVDIIYQGFWTYPVNQGQVFKLLPTFKNIPSCFFTVSIKKDD